MRREKSVFPYAIWIIQRFQLKFEAYMKKAVRAGQYTDFAFIYLFCIRTPPGYSSSGGAYSNGIKDSDQGILVSRHKRMFIRDGRVGRRDQNDDRRLASCDDNWWCCERWRRGKRTLSFFVFYFILMGFFAL